MEQQQHTSLEHYLALSSLNDEHPKVQKAHERDFIPDLTPSERRALVMGLMGSSDPDAGNEDPNFTEGEYYSMYYEPGSEFERNADIGTPREESGSL